jgi:hypothetical protein
LHEGPWEASNAHAFDIYGRCLGLVAALSPRRATTALTNDLKCLANLCASHLGGPPGPPFLLFIEFELTKGRKRRRERYSAAVRRACRTRLGSTILVARPSRLSTTITQYVRSNSHQRCQTDAAAGS